MDIAEFQENEIQALIILSELCDPVETPNNNSYKFYPNTVKEAQTYFRRFTLDISDVYPSLLEKGYVSKEDDAWRLTEEGRLISREVRRARPPIWYWYKDFYMAIETSKVFSEYCERVFGRDMSQHGFCDLAELNFMLDVIKLSRGKRVLDIGCGNGGIAEYISDSTGADVTGIDYIPEAIEQARGRTVGKGDRLHFMVGNLERLAFGRRSYDHIIAIDSIFFGKEMEETVGNLKKLLKPGGTMAVYCDEVLGAALGANGLDYDAYDRSRELYTHLQLKHRVAQELMGAFEAEGNGFIAGNLLVESLAGEAPYDPGKWDVKRYLYHVRSS